MTDELDVEEELEELYGGKSQRGTGAAKFANNKFRERKPDKDHQHPRRFSGNDIRRPPIVPEPLPTRR